MKKEIHPEYKEAVVTCGCGETFKTRSTKAKINVEICSKCHPFYTGKQKYVDTAGRVEKFIRRYSSVKKKGEAKQPARSDSSPKEKPTEEAQAEVKENPPIGQEESHEGETEPESEDQ